MDKDTLTLTKYLIPLSPTWLREQTQQLQLDRYVKKLDAATTAKVFIFAQLMQFKHYTDISRQVNQQKKLQEAVGLSSISTSQLSRRWRDLDYTFMERVYQHVVQQVTDRYGVAKAGQKLGQMQLIDATTMTLCLSKYPWATYSKHKGAVRLHLRFIQTAAGGYPDVAVLTNGNVAERKHLDDLEVYEAGALLVFDRGYVDYKRFDEYCTQAILFVTRLRCNADFKEIEIRQVPPDSEVLTDRIVWLGYQGTRYRMKHYVRIIECLDKDGNVMMLCTSDFKRSAEELRQIYRYRWKIEMFFKWIKQHFHVKQFYGTSRNAVFNQIYAALIAFCLGLLMQGHVHHKGKLLELVKQVRMSWSAPLWEMLRWLFAKPGRESKGRRKAIDVEQQYEAICRASETGELRQLEMLEYGMLL
ncbi:IS4 family transposase [Paenibacillus koleovorans]|uniref:IS4 family transposase n=1 Tax=Paenibacillus koleovorans TaxID=121608 RepID=UPI0013E2C58A|nr:IS4 family transposase [Paenibacillus koleovorans]